MKYKPFKNRKKDFDNIAMIYFARRLFEDIGETCASQEGITDSVGNIVKEPTSKNEWAFTHFDRLMLALKHSLGETYLKNLLKEYEWTRHIDPMMIMNASKEFDFEKARKNLGMIATKLDEVTYLPMELKHKSEHIEGEPEEESDNLNFCDRVSKGLTMATFLLYCLRNDKLPNSQDFEVNIIPSMEITFNIRPHGTFEDCRDFCKKYELVEGSHVSEKGMRLLADVSKCLVDGNIISEKVKNRENQTQNWKNLAKLAKKYE